MHRMTPTITAFAASPDRGRGLARDMRIRWALEEVGQPYTVRLVSFAHMKEPAHIAIQPFGQIPTYEDGDLALFETGAIILHIAETHPGLLPKNANARARTTAWMFAAVATVEPPIVELSGTMMFDRDKPWFDQRLPQLHNAIRKRLGELSRHLGDSEWLDGDFSAADIMMIHVIQRAKSSALIGEFPNLNAYLTRAESRPAFQRAFAAQLKVFEDAQKP